MDENGGDDGGSGGAAARNSLVDGAERALREWLSPSRFREGDRLPPEHQLATMLGISRGTLRSALSRLAETGEVVRRQGSGTFAGRRAASSGFDRRLLRVESYALHHTGNGWSVDVLGIEKARLGPAAGDALELDSDERTTRVQRVIRVDGVPAVVTRDFFHPDVVLPSSAALRAQFDAGRTPHEVLALCGSPLTLSRTRITSLLVCPDDDIGQWLGLEDRTSCLVLEEILLADGGCPLFYCFDVLAPGLIELEVVQSAIASLPDPVSARDATVSNGASA